jgi:hypothetical protein
VCVCVNVCVCACVCVCSSVIVISIGVSELALRFTCSSLTPAGVTLPPRSASISAELLRGLAKARQRTSASFAAADTSGDPPQVSW